MIFYGWMRRPTLLAVKTDLCPTCHTMGVHAIVRAVTWVQLYAFPVLPVWFDHLLICQNCLANRKLKRRQVINALKRGQLVLGPRPDFREFARQQFQETGRSPQESELDAVEVNPNRGNWDRYLRWWLLIVPSVIVALVALAALR